MYKYGTSEHHFCTLDSRKRFLQTRNFDRMAFAKGKWTTLFYISTLLWFNITCQKFRNETQYPCLRKELKEDAQITCLDETISVLNAQFPSMLEFTSSRGDAFENLRRSVRGLNLNVRENYRRLMEDTGKNVFPLLVATDSEPDFAGVGGVWKVYFKNGTMKRIAPVSSAYEMNKSLSHMIVGIFSIISPYFQNPVSINWQPALRTFHQQIKELLFLLRQGESGIHHEDRNHMVLMLNEVNTYIRTALETNTVHLLEFRRFTNNMVPLIQKSMEKAAEAQAEGTIPGLQQLKEEMGEEWTKLYVLIPTTWPVSLYNIRLQALEKFMSFDQIKAQVILVEGTLTEDAAKMTLGRVIADRAIAQMVWGGLDDQVNQGHLYSLSTRRDLLSSVAAEKLEEQCQQPDRPKCPFSGRSQSSKFSTMVRF